MAQGGGLQPMGFMQMLTGTGAFKPQAKEEPAKGPQNAFDVSGMSVKDLSALRNKLGMFG